MRLVPEIKSSLLKSVDSSELKLPACIRTPLLNFLWLFLITFAMLQALDGMLSITFV